MTELTADASSTSAGWISSPEFDELLAATWPNRQSLLSRGLRSDSDVKTSGRSFSLGFAVALAFVALAAFWKLSRRASPAEADAQGETRPPPPQPDIGVLIPVQTALRHLSGEVADRARAVVDRLSTELRRIDLTGLPPIHASVEPAGAFTLEWTFGRRRLGLNVEVKPDESSWYYVSFEPGRIESESGPLTSIDLPVQIRRLAEK